MFAVLYRVYLRPGKEKEFQHHWRKVASFFIEKRGAIGSSLHRGEDGLWIAYSRWPDRATRDASWPISDDPAIQNTIAALKECFDPDRTVPDICMEVVEDLL